MLRGVGGCAAATLALVFAAPAAADTVVSAHGVTARIAATTVTLENALAKRSWSRAPFRTTALADLRGGGRAWSTAAPDFRLQLAGLDVLTSADFRVAGASAAPTKNGVRVTLELVPTLTGSAPLGLAVTRTAEAYAGVAGFRTQTTLKPALGLVLGGATLEEAATVGAAPTLHAFRAGADWREPEWTGPPITVGDPHAGTWRETRTGPSGAALAGPAQWLSLASGSRSLFMVMERNDLPSSRAAYDGRAASLRVEHARDIVVIGPFEENAHVENPTELNAGRVRVIPPGGRLALAPVFTGFGLGDGDEAWQFHRYLVEHRLAPYRREATFNSNGTDADVISTGAKDDMDFATVQAVAPKARRLGIETFILDDGWQAISGDWYPDSPQHPEPRWDGTPTSKFRPRFPDDKFTAVREAIAPMKLGLWMSPMHFNPRSATYAAHPEWACAPVGHALALYNAADPHNGSNEAGIGAWGPAAIPHIERRIRTAITEWGVEYFKFDFLAWLDCVGQGDLYDMHDRFVAMIDRLQAAYPHVTFQIDETNDYRLFPFESVARAPSWFQNGSPDVPRLLHNIWNLSPYVPAFSLGQHVLGGNAWQRHPVGTLMAAALPSHITVFSDLRQLPDAVVDEAAPWLSWYRANRGLLDGVTYPLLADPLGSGWTALQVWDPSAAEGVLLAFRQDADTATQRIALRNVPAGRTFELRRAPGGAVIRTASSQDLIDGIDVTIDEARGAAVFAIEEVA